MMKRVFSRRLAIGYLVGHLTTACILYAQVGEVKRVQTTPRELVGFGMTFEKLDFRFSTPVSARFWIDYHSGTAKPRRQEVPHDHMLPTNHYALSYVQDIHDQVAVSVMSDSEPPLNCRTGETSGGDGSGTRTVTYKVASPNVEIGKDIELFAATIKPPWRRPHDPVQTFKVMARFSEAEFPEDPIPLEDNAAWQIVTDKRLAILRRGKNSFDWKNVSPKIFAAVVKANLDESSRQDVVGLSAISTNEAWVAVVMENIDQRPLLIEHTTDGGKHWHEIATPIKADAVKLSFVNPDDGFLLALGSPAAGLMDKAVYATTDSGVHWQKVTPPPENGMSYYPTGMIFRSTQEGWITATYHGAPDVPLFHTRDGGKTWELQRLDIPPEFVGGYADTYPPFFYTVYGKPFLKGQLPVKLVRHEPAPDHTAWRYFYTEDGGATWHLPPAAKDHR